MLKLYKNFVFKSQSSQQKLADSLAGGKVKSSLFNVLALTAGAVSALLLLSVFFALLVIPGSIVAYLLWRKFRNLPLKANDESLSAEYRVIKDDEVK